MDFEEIPKPPEHVVRYAMGLVSGPCIAMIILGFAVRVSEPPVLFVASMQHLAAGIVLSAVAVELVPVITDAESTAGNIAGITLGFVFGVALFLARAPAMHVALISFGIAALLFLVTEELLLEAHEAQEHSAHEEHIWWVDMFFFLGFLLSFLMDKLLDTD